MKLKIFLLFIEKLIYLSLILILFIPGLFSFLALMLIGNTFKFVLFVWFKLAFIGLSSEAKNTLREFNTYTVSLNNTCNKSIICKEYIYTDIYLIHLKDYFKPWPNECDDLYGMFIDCHKYSIGKWRLRAVSGC